MTTSLILRNSVEQAAWLALTPTQRADALAGTDYTNFKGRKFRVIFGGFKPSYRKMSSVTETPDGFLDISVGPVFHEATYTLRTADELSADEVAECYGTYDELKAYFLLNNPQPLAGQPSNLITLVDLYGVEHEGILGNSIEPEPLTTILEGPYAFYFVQIFFRERTAVA